LFGVFSDVFVVHFCVLRHFFFHGRFVCAVSLWAAVVTALRRVATGAYRYIYRPKSSKVNLLCNNNDDDLSPQKYIPPQNKFLAMPLIAPHSFLRSFLAVSVDVALNHDDDDE